MRHRPFLLATLASLGLFLTFLVLVLLASSSPRNFALTSLGERIGVVEVKGVIHDSSQVVEALVDFRDDERIRAILIRVDSPGGGVGPSQEIHREVSKAVQVKPVVVSMGAVAASGGYYLAAPATRILANPGTITGSIGVVMEFTNFRDLLDKIGLQNEVVKSGLYKDVGSPTREMTEDERVLLQTLIDEVHRQFVEAVVEGRKLEPEVARALADGRILTGTQALGLNLIDELGNFQDAIDAAGRLGGIDGRPRLIYAREERRGLLDYLLQSTTSQLRESLADVAQPGLKFLWNP